MDKTVATPLEKRLTDDDILLTRPEAAKYLRRATITLEKWSQAGIGPKPKRVGGRVLYQLSVLRKFVEEA